MVQTAVDDLANIVVGDDPMDIERLHQKMIVAIMGHGMTGTPGSGAINAIDMALWDIKGKVLNTPVWNLLGGRVRKQHPNLCSCGIRQNCALEIERTRHHWQSKPAASIAQSRSSTAIRRAVGDEMDIMVDAHGPPWFTTKDAIIVGKGLEPYNLLFYEDPVPPENTEAMRRVQDNVDIPIAAGERHSHIWGVREIIEDEIVDVVQPDSGRIGGITQLKKIAALAEAHYINVAPHSGSLGPVAEYAAIHILASISNALILERLEDDVPQRYEVIQPHLPTVDGYITVPEEPGLGVDFDEDVVAANPPDPNVRTGPDPSSGHYAPGTYDEYVYYQQRYRRGYELPRLR